MAADQECLAHYPGSQSEVPLVRRQPARGVRQGNGAVPRRTIERRPKHRRSADLGSDVPQRAARATLRCAWRVRQSFPARDAHRWESVRPPRQSGGAVGDVVFDPDGTDHPWQVAARECSGRPATRPAAQCACARREREGRQAAVGPRDAGGTSKESRMRQLSRADGSAGAEPRELRRDRPLAQDRKSTRLNSSHLGISYAVFCLKKNKLNVIFKQLFHIRVRRNFGVKMLPMTNLSTESLVGLTKLSYNAKQFYQILKQTAI